MASDTITAAAAAKSKDRPPPMGNHTPNEFVFAGRTLHKMVLDSEFFPERAERADWFRPHDAIIIDDAKANSGNEERSAPTEKMHGMVVAQRRPSVESAASIATASTSASSISPIHRRRTIGIPVVDEPPGPPLVSAASLDDDDAVDDGTKSISLPPLAKTLIERRASVDKNAHLNTAPTKTISPKGAAKEYAPVPSIHEKDIDYGAILGLGGFCEVRFASLKKDNYNVVGATAGNDHQRRYAMKYLSPTKTTPKDPQPKANTNKATAPPRNKQFERGIADLAIEARFLTLLSHANIIGLHYVSQGNLDTQFNCEGENNYYHQFGYFLLLDPLFETLAKRIDETYIPQVFRGGNDERSGIDVVPASSSSWWKRMMHKNTANNSLPLDAWKIQLAQRLESLKGIASALQYLHDDCRVIYRDVKPDNIGFYRRPHPQCYCGKRSSSSSANQESTTCTCYTEIPKLFDFGLAKELKPKYLKAHPNHNNDPQHTTKVDTYKLTPRSGSRRYMSPEVAFSNPYNEKADVYSFGVVLYQVASLITPFEGYSLNRHEEEVLSCGDRPNIKIPRNKRSLMKSKKSSTSYVNWLAQSDVKKKEKHLASCTKCVWTKELKCLLGECWHDDMRLRPSMKDVVKRLEGCIQELTEHQRSGQVVVPNSPKEKTKTMIVRGLSMSTSLCKSNTQETECVSSGGESDWGHVGVSQ